MTEHRHTGREPSADRLTRRRILAGTAAVTAAAVSGCLEDDDVDAGPTDPIDLAGETCEVCGMLIDEHHGPAGQVFFADGRPPDRDGPARFDSVTELLAYVGERERKGWETLAVYVTDYSRVDYDVVEIEGRQYVSSHVAPGDFADATELSYVTGSRVEGAMGADHVPFSEPDDAVAFADEYGGDVETWDELATVDGASG